MHCLRICFSLKRGLRILTGMINHRAPDIWIRLEKVQLFNSSYTQSIQTSCCLSSCSFSLFSQWPLLLFSLSPSLSLSLAFIIIRGEGALKAVVFEEISVVSTARATANCLPLSVLLNYYFRLTDMTSKTVIFPTNTFVSEALLCVIVKEVGKVRKYILSRALYFVSDWFSVSLITSRQPQEGEVDQNIFEMVLSPVPLFCSSL